jgi:hypothetical protein
MWHVPQSADINLSESSPARGTFTNKNMKFNFIYKREEGDGRGGIFVIEMVRRCGEY